jgi:hypothetical protein
MPRLLGILVVLAGLVGVPAEAGERWPSRAKRCDALSWFCAGPRGLENRLPPSFFGVPSYARPDRPDFAPRRFRPGAHYRPPQHRAFPHFIEPRRDRVERFHRRGPVICDPGRGVCFQFRRGDSDRWRRGLLTWRDRDAHDRWSDRDSREDRRPRRLAPHGIY